MNSLVLRYFELLREYNEQVNIYSKHSYDKLPFHAEDSTCLASIIRNDRLTVVDFGSGSGFPSIIIAIMNPNNKVYAVESKHKKCVFLEYVRHDLGLDNLIIINQNVFEFVRTVQFKVDVVTAKAFASFDKVYKLASVISSKGMRIYIPYSKKQVDMVNQDDIIYQDPFYYRQFRF